MIILMQNLGANHKLVLQPEKLRKKEIRRRDITTFRRNVDRSLLQHNRTKLLVV